MNSKFKVKVAGTNLFKLSLEIQLADKKIDQFYTRVVDTGCNVACYAPLTQLRDKIQGNGLSEDSQLGSV